MYRNRKKPKVTERDKCSLKAWETATVKHKRKRDVQLCDADQSLGDSQGGNERIKGGENTHRDCMCVYVEQQKE